MKTTSLPKRRAFMACMAAMLTVLFLAVGVATPITAHANTDTDWDFYGIPGSVIMELGTVHQYFMDIELDFSFKANIVEQKWPTVKCVCPTIFCQCSKTKKQGRWVEHRIKLAFFQFGVKDKESGVNKAPALEVEMQVKEPFQKLTWWAWEDTVVTFKVQDVKEVSITNHFYKEVMRFEKPVYEKLFTEAKAMLIYNNKGFDMGTIPVKSVNFRVDENVPAESLDPNSALWNFEFAGSGLWNDVNKIGGGGNKTTQTSGCGDIGNGWTTLVYAVIVLIVVGLLAALIQWVIGFFRKKN